jgi:hypothetical protein
VGLGPLNTLLQSCAELRRLYNTTWEEEQEGEIASP